MARRLSVVIKPHAQSKSQNVTGHVSSSKRISGLARHFGEAEIFLTKRGVRGDLKTLTMKFPSSYTYT